MGDLDGKAVVVTGAAQGIGAAIAREIARLGAAVIVGDLDSGRAEAVAADIRAAGGTAQATAADIRSWDDARRLIGSCVDQFGAIDGLVNNAGVFRVCRPEEQGEDDLRLLLDTNVVGTVACATHALREMLPRGRGSIVNVTSGAQAGLPLMAAYGASKGAVASFTYSWASDLAGTGVRVNALSPLADTRMADVTADYQRERGMEPWPAPPVRPEANAPVVAYLLSDAAADVTGQVVRIEGRQLALMTHPAVLHPPLERDTWTLDDVRRAFDRDLRTRLQPTGVTALRAEPAQGGSEFWSTGGDRA